MIIIEEGNLPHPRYPWCEILVPWKDLNRQHVTTNQCANGAEQKTRHGEDFSGLQQASCDVHLVLIPGEDIDGGR